VDALEKLIATEEIRQVKARWWRAIDEKDTKLFRSCLADIVELDFRGAMRDSHDPDEGIQQEATETLWTDVEAAVDSIMGVANNVFGKTAHHGSVGWEIEFESSVKARAIFPMIDHIVMLPGNPHSEITGYGQYFDTFERIDGAWKVTASRLVRLRMDFVQNKAYIPTA
jgi:SnoaL-like domain